MQDENKAVEYIENAKMFLIGLSANPQLKEDMRMLAKHRAEQLDKALTILIPF